MIEYRHRKYVGRGLVYAALGVAAVQALGPVLWVLSGSLKSKADFFSHPWGMPRAWLFHNYVDAFAVARVGNYVWNSLTVVVLGLSILLFTATTTAYALARLEFPARRAITAIILITMMVPPDVLTIPLFIVLRELGLLGMEDVAYVKRVMVDGAPAFAVHAADGAEIAVLPDRDLAFAVVRQQDLQPVSVH